MKGFVEVCYAECSRQRFVWLALILGGVANEEFHPGGQEGSFPCPRLGVVYISDASADGMFKGWLIDGQGVGLPSKQCPQPEEVRANTHGNWRGYTPTKEVGFSLDGGEWLLTATPIRKRQPSPLRLRLKLYVREQTPGPDIRRLDVVVLSKFVGISFKVRKP
jgi:hypothetical protein